MNRLTGIAGMAVVLLASCGGGSLHNLDTGSVGPDEFSVLPALPLQMPETTTLPPPTPGASNLSDPNPVGDAMAALGGSQAASFAGGIPASDATLVAYAGRNGTDPAIRNTLATEDAAFRSQAGFGGTFNLLGRDRYYPAYASQSLDAYAELERFRAAGVEGPTAPPETD